MQDLQAIRFIPDSKVSHDTLGKDIKTFSYRDLIHRKIECVGIPCKTNRLIVIDVDVAGATHKKDGRNFWNKFVEEKQIPPTYTVSTQSGGFHFYFSLPEYINPDTFSPPAELAPGVDIKWAGWVAAPPTAGYRPVYGTLADILEVPESLLEEISGLIKGKASRTFEGDEINIHSPFTPEQIEFLKLHMPFIQANCTLNRAEWRDGIFSLKAGIDDPALLEELVTSWSMNQGYVPGDERVALDMAEKASKHGAVGPATILQLVKNKVRLETIPVSSATTMYTVSEVLERAKVIVEFDGKGNPKVEPTETNAAALLGAMYTTDQLYYDTRMQLYIFDGKSHSDTELVNTFLPVIQCHRTGLNLPKFRKQAVAAGLEVLMAQRKKDPHKEYLNSLKWDGVRRIHRFFVDYVGADDGQYHQLVGVNFWTSLAARGLKPGCKFDSMVVLEGHEGISKSSLVAAIGGSEYTFASSRADGLENLDELRKMHQSVIVELPELMGLMGQNAEKVKAALAKPSDNIRDLYAKQGKVSPRGFVFIGTTNNERYLSSAMGHRRFWPVRIPKKVKSVDMSRLISDRDQLFAEGIHEYYAGHKYWHVPPELLDPVVSARVHQEPIMAPLKEALKTLPAPYKTLQIYYHLQNLGIFVKGYSTETVHRIEDAMRRLKFEESEAETWVPMAPPKFHVEVPMTLDDLL